MPTNVLDRFLEAMPALDVVDASTIICVASGPDYLSYQLAIPVLFYSPEFLGEPTAPTPDPADNSTRLATTEFVQGLLAGFTGGGGSSIPVGPPGSVQYNEAGAPGGFGNWDGSTLALTGPGTTTLDTQGVDVLGSGYIPVGGVNFHNTGVNTGSTKIAAITALTGSSFNLGQLYFYVKMESSEIEPRLVGQFDEMGDFFINEGSLYVYNGGLTLGRGISLGSSDEPPLIESNANRGNTFLLEGSSGQMEFDAYGSTIFLNNGQICFTVRRGTMQVIGVGNLALDLMAEGASSASYPLGGINFHNNLINGGTSQLASVQGYTGSTSDVGELHFYVKKAVFDPSPTLVAKFDEAGVLSLSGAFGPHGGTRISKDTGPFDLSTGDWFYRTLNGANGFISVMGEKPGQAFMLEFIQDVNGNHTLDYGSFGVLIWMTSNGNPPPIALAPNKRTILAFKQTEPGARLGWLHSTQV